jgi:regulatory protein
VRRHRKPETAAGEADERTVRTAALALLAGRDFARAELAARLIRRGYPAPLVEAVVDRLAAERLQSDDRFAGEFVSRNAARGRGPARIRMELRERGVATGAADDTLAASGVDWAEAARVTRRRRFGAALPADFRERAKQARFLQYRGFSAEQIRAALGEADVPDDPVIGPGAHDDTAES